MGAAHLAKAAERCTSSSGTEGAPAGSCSWRESSSIASAWAVGWARSERGARERGVQGADGGRVFQPYSCTLLAPPDERRSALNANGGGTLTFPVTALSPPCASTSLNAARCTLSPSSCTREDSHGLARRVGEEGRWHRVEQKEARTPDDRRAFSGHCGERLISMASLTAKLSIRPRARAGPHALNLRVITP